MPGFTSGGGMPAKAKKKDGTFPSKKAASVTRGGGQPVKPKGADGVDFESTHMDEAMTDGGEGPARGPSFGSKSKFDAGAMSQAIRKRRG